jgi:hypothetical protein
MLSRIGGAPKGMWMALGYQNFVLHLPEAQTALVILMNSDDTLPVDNGAGRGYPANLLATAITSVLSPDHVCDFPAVPAAATPSSSPTA